MGSDRINSSGPPRGVDIRVQLVCWTTSAMLAFFYLLSFVLTPGQDKFVGNSMDLRPGLSGRKNDDREKVVRIYANKQRIATIEKDVAGLHTIVRDLGRKVERNGQQRAALARRLKAIETALGPTTASIRVTPRRDENPPDSPNPFENTGRRQAAGSQPFEPLATKPEIVVKYLPLPEHPGAMEAAPPEDTKIVAKRRTLVLKARFRRDAANQSQFGVQIVSSKSLRDLRRRWRGLTTRHTDLLNGLQARYTRWQGAQQNRYDLVAGPFEDAALAARLCSKLKTRNLACRTTAFRGKPLAGSQVGADLTPPARSSSSRKE